MPQKKGRKVPPLQPGERKQYKPGQLRDSLDPIVRDNIEHLATLGYERDGRGALMVELDDTQKSGIRSAQYHPIEELAKMNRAVPFGNAQPISEVITAYNPEREFVAIVMDISPDLPGPQLWFDVFPREHKTPLE
jgi:hypothetical protein